MSVYKIQLARSKKCHQTTLGNPKNSFSMTDCFVQLQLQLHKFSEHESRFCFSQTVVYCCLSHTHTHTHTHTIWIILEQETVGGSGTSWAICKSAPRFRRITTPAPHHSSFLQAGCPSCRPTNSVKALKSFIVAYQLTKLSTLRINKKQDTKLLPIISPNVNRFSKLFH